MGLSYLNELEIMEWAPWLWVIVALKWTADQGKPVPTLTPAWRTGECDVGQYGGILLKIWIPEAADVVIDEFQIFAPIDHQSIPSSE